MSIFKYKCCSKINKSSLGFGLVEAILSAALLSCIITYGIYFATLRLGLVQRSQLTRAINKEIQRDIERLKSELWSIYFDNKEGKYTDQTYKGEINCSSISDTVLNLESWETNSDRKSQSPSRIFSNNSLNSIKNKRNFVKV